MGDELLIGLGAVAAALSLGLIPAMTLFVGRLAFSTLDEVNAARFLRSAFQAYYIMLACFATVGGLVLAGPRPIDAVLMGGVAFLALYARLWLLPIAHRLADIKLSGMSLSIHDGEAAAAKKKKGIIGRLAASATDAVGGGAQNISLNGDDIDHRELHSALMKIQGRSSFIAVAQIGACIGVVVRLAIL